MCPQRFLFLILPVLAIAQPGALAQNRTANPDNYFPAPTISLSFSNPPAADNSVVAVDTPFNVGDNPTFQYGCWAVNLNLLGSGSPFTSVAAIAEDYDTDVPNGTTEEQGSNGCT
ncbi:MAG: hypothetical protein ABSF64_11455 [Bryobacteraceae bacterium]|jgi:hypothetical protein